MYASVCVVCVSVWGGGVLISLRCSLKFLNFVASDRFSLIFPHREYFLAAESEEGRQSWIKAIASSVGAEVRNALLSSG